MSLPAVPDEEMTVDTFLTRLVQAGQEVEASGEPKPFAQGSFAMYPMPDGGIMAVTNVTEGPMIGLHHNRIPPNFVRAGLLFAAGDKLAAIKELTGGMFGFGKRKK